jgi:dihydrolipoamide dehydrogenase
MTQQEFDCIVIGGGPGGYVAAIRAAQRGLKTALIESLEMGGTCLNRGCIPSKALIANAEVLRKVREANKFGISVGSVSFNYQAMKERKDQVVARLRKGVEGLIASNQITSFKGFGKFISPFEVKVIGDQEAVLKGKSIIIATGSEPRPLPGIPFDHQTIHDSTSLLDITELPKKILIIGGGVVGCEFACLHHAFGVDVTIIELLPSILSTEGKAIGDTMAQIFKKQGIKIETQAALTHMEKVSQGVKAHLSDGRVFEADCALISVGRKYNTDKIGLENIGVIVEKDGSIPVNSFMQTNVPHIFAIGDITGKWALAHVASHQGMIAANNAAGVYTEMDYAAVPSVIFTSPEVATIGYTLEKAIQAGFDARIGKFPFQALGKALAAIETEGFAQIVVEKNTGQILGAQVVGYGASTLIAEMAVAIGNELTIKSISDTIHAHPTIAEAWMEAAFLADEMPLHLPPIRK